MCSRSVIERCCIWIAASFNDCVPFIVLCLPQLAKCHSGLVFNFPLFVSIQPLIVLRHQFLNFVLKLLHFVIMNYDEHVDEEV